MEQKIGLSNWNQEIKGRPNQPDKKDVFMRLQDGDNKVRIITEPYQYLSFKYKEENDAGFGDKVNASMPLETDPLYLRGFKPKRRWLVGVINRKTDQFELLDISVVVYKAIQNLFRDEAYGDPKTYDVVIKVDRNGGATGYYNVIPRPPTPLTEKDLKIIQESNHEEVLVRRCTPPSANWVKARVNAIREKKHLPAINWDEVVATPTAATTTVPAVDMGDDGEDFEFSTATA